MLSCKNSLYSNYKCGKRYAITSFISDAKRLGKIILDFFPPSFDAGKTEYRKQVI